MSVEIEPTENGGASRSVETGSDGLFAFDGVEQGKYRLSASKRGYLPQAYEQHDNFSTAIVVGPELQSEGLIFKVVPQAVITGVVTDERGEPVRRAQVRLFKDEDRGGIRSTVPRQTAMTDDRGVYELARIDPGNYYLAVSGRPWYAQTVSHPQPNENPRRNLLPRWTSPIPRRSIPRRLIRTMPRRFLFEVASASRRT